MAEALRTGWIEITEMLGEELLLETRDGGRSWKDVTGEFPVFPHILDATHWWDATQASADAEEASGAAR